ncbi:hypothetical protein HAX54_001799 [Datura stramonium]|uniref:Uncharacterized protein n=1 Tax=Datura stramonium TaxID=4076 RepID=A0ABS8WVR3_DATST|nr:hypothetical protein [Datura stramonium]
MGYPIQSDIRSAIQIAAVFRRHNHQYHYLTNHRLLLPPAVISYRNSPNCCFTVNSALKLRAFTTNDGNGAIQSTTFQKVSSKPSLCTADELHYVSVNNSDWKLALWRYIIPAESVSGFLNESQSRIMSAKLFDQISKLLEDSFLYERFNETRGKLLSLLETRQNSAVADQVKDLSQRLVNIIEEGQRSVSPPLVDLHERLTTTIEDFQKQLDLIAKYDWDFDHYLEEDVPAAMEYIKAQTAPKDGKLLAIGHSMGGILLYARLSQCAADMMHPELLKKQVMNNFCTIPAKNIYHKLTTAFRRGGLRDRSGKIFYKDNLHKSTTAPSVAVAGDKIICPPEAVCVLGDANGQHYAHYDLVGGRMAADACLSLYNPIFEPSLMMLAKVYALVLTFF